MHTSCSAVVYSFLRIANISNLLFQAKVRDFDEKSETAQTIEIDAYCDVSSAAGSSFISRSSRGPASDRQLKRSVSDVVQRPKTGVCVIFY